jgi:hypothetical protein
MVTVVPTAEAVRFVGAEMGVTAVDVAELAVTYPLVKLNVKLYDVPTTPFVNILVPVPDGIPEAESVPNIEYVYDPVGESVQGTVIVVPLTVTVPIVGGTMKSGNCEGTVMLYPPASHQFV